MNDSKCLTFHWRVCWAAKDKRCWYETDQRFIAKKGIGFKPVSELRHFVTGCMLSFDAPTSQFIWKLAKLCDYVSSKAEHWKPVL